MSNSGHSFSSSEESLSTDEKPILKGVLSKWTNYYYGWQDRYVCCEEGSLQYFRSLDEVGIGCRGSMSLAKAVVTTHEFDPCRFDVTIKDSTWYLRSNNEAERQSWVEVIEANMIERDNVSVQNEEASLQSSPFDSDNEFKAKLSELSTLRHILSSQIDVLQRYFDACLAVSGKNGFDDWVKSNESGTPVDADRLSFFQDAEDGSLELSKVDLKREALSFKVTTSGIETALNNFLTLANERETMWKNKCEKLERKLLNSGVIVKPEPLCPPSVKPDVVNVSSDEDSDDEFYDPNNNFEGDEKKRLHRFSKEVEDKIKEHLEDSFRIPGECDDKWELLAEDGEMRLFRTELVRDGVVCDPMKAVHGATGVTGRELCNFFWETSSRTEWDHTIEELEVLEEINDDTVIIHQVHKQVWPIAQRDCLYISTILKVENPPQKPNGPKPHDTWMVCNFSVDHNAVKDKPDRVRAIVEVALVCQTYVTQSEKSPLTRDCLNCDIVYIANVNPGGWAPAPLLRAVGKREYPKFLRNFTDFVQDKTKRNEIWF